MAIRKVARLGHPILRQAAAEVPPGDITSAAIRQLVADMRETMVEYAGVGLAAPQVHEPLRIVVVEVDLGDDERPDPRSLTLFNPRTTVLDDTPLGNWEGCLSVPDLRGYVERPSRIRVDYRDEQARPQTIEAGGFLATVLQHELDHLDGVLYVDKLADPTRFAFVQEFSRYHLWESNQEK